MNQLSLTSSNNMHKQTKRKLPSIRSIEKSLSLIYFIFFLSSSLAGCNCANPDDDNFESRPSRSTFELEDAIKDNNIEKVKKILKSKHDQTTLYFPLHKAIDGGNLDIVKLLLQNGAKVGEAHLTSAIKAGNLDIVKLLLQNGASDPSSLPDALKQAVDLGNPEIVKILVENGADVNNSGGWAYTPLERAINSNKTEVVKYMLEEAIDERIKPKIIEKIIASEKGEPTMLKSLIEAGTIDLTQKEGASYVFEAIEERNPLVFDCLLEGLKKKNVDIEQFVDNYGKNLLEQVFANPRSADDDKIIERLLDENIDIENKINYRNDYTTPLGAAIKRGSLPVIEKLLEKIERKSSSSLKQEINGLLDFEVSDSGFFFTTNPTVKETFLHHAIRKRNKPLIKLLRKYGAWTNVKDLTDPNSKTVDELANSNEDIAKLLYGNEDYT
jgi:ankyrin repeat protein